MEVQDLSAAIAAVCPIDGIALSDKGAPWPTVAAADGSLWRIDYQPQATDAQKQAAQQIVQAWSATKAASLQLNFLGFLALFTATEQAAIVNSMDSRIKLFCLMAAGASAVDLTDPRTVSGTNLLESLGLIGKGRSVQVLAGQAPPAS